MSTIVAVVLFLTMMSVALNIRNRQGMNVQSLSSHRIMFCVVASVSWGLLSALRHVRIGADTRVYEYLFESVKNVPLEELWDRVVQTYFTRTATYKDPGYNLLVKLLQFISDEYRFLLFFIAAVFFGSMGVWIYRNSQMPYVSFLLFSTLFYSFFAFTGHRQTIATALVVFVGHEWIRKRKLLPYILLMLVASTLHKSCLCYILAYFVYPFKGYSRRKYMTVLAISLLLLTISGPVMNLVSGWFDYEQYMENDLGGTGTFVFLYFLVMAITLWKFPSIVQENPDAYHTLNILVIGTLSVAMSLFNQSFMRLQQYYTVYLMLLLPDIIVSFRGKNRFIVGVSGCCLLLALMLKNNPAYMFYWQ